VEVHERNDPDESFLAFELEASRQIRGTVRSSNGALLDDAPITVLSRDPIFTVRTNSRGAFLVEGLTGDTCRLAVRATAHRERTLEVVPDGKPLEIVLEHRPPLGGIVIDRSSGGPVAEAELRLRARAGSEEYELLARADGEGRFVISRYPEDVSAVLVEAWGYSGGEVSVPDPPPAEGWVIELDRCGSVSGRVQAPGKLPVQGVKVWLARDETEGARGAAREGSARVLGAVQYMEDGGFFRLFVAEAGTYRVLVDGGPFAPAVSEPIAVPHAQAEVQGIVIALELAGGAQGVVFSRDLGRVAGARVLAIPDADTASPLARRRETMADAAGAFAIDGLRAGAYRLVAGAPGFASAPSEPFLVQGGGTPATVHLELEPEMTISGRVVDDATGSPISLAEIQAVAAGEAAGEPWREERSKSSVLGTFRLSRLAAGRYDLRFEAEGFGPVLIGGVDAGRDDIEARLERLVPLSGKVSGAFTGDPVAVFKLRIRLDDEGRLSGADRESLQAWRDFNDPAGAFRIDDIPPGRYLLDAEAPLHLGLQALEIEVLAGEGLADADVRLQESGLIAGAVIDAHGMAVSGARVEALERRIDPERGTVSYESVRVPAPRSAGAESSGGRSGGPRREGGERRGRGRGGENRDRETIPAVATTREDGSFVIRGLPDGMYRLSIAHDDHLPRELGDLVFESGLCANPALASGILLASGVALRGRVRGLAETDGGRISISLRPVPGPDDPPARRMSGSKTARVDASGHFEIRGLATGDYILSARFRRASDGSFASIRRDVNIHGAGREQGILLDLGR
jgi:hypothetical protein